jgi:hypothetical protein
MITFIANLTWQLANFNPKIIFFHNGTLIDTFWLASPDDLKRHKNNVGALIKLLPENIQRLPEICNRLLNLSFSGLEDRPPGL